MFEEFVFCVLFIVRLKGSGTPLPPRAALKVHSRGTLTIRQTNLEVMFRKSLQNDYY